MPPDRQCELETHEIHHIKELDCKPVVSLSFKHHAGDCTIWLVSTLILRENTLGLVRGFPPLFPFHKPHERLDSYLEYPPPSHATKAIHLLPSMPSPGFESRPYGTAVSFTNRFIGWAAE
ncbi:hypothetical protein TNCV_3802021 [Trichonephila clavipes]|nr:hypothetical protein TNCV_3802021 [Trichonephila clavipes]